VIIEPIQIFSSLLSLFSSPSFRKLEILKFVKLLSVIGANNFKEEEYCFASDQSPNVS
jgi:hypothetical protein